MTDDGDPLRLLPHELVLGVILLALLVATAALEVAQRLY